MKLRRVKKQKQEAPDKTPPSSIFKRISLGGVSVTQSTSCFFCDESTLSLHQVSTLVLDKNVRQCALELQDTALLAKLMAEDFVSQEAVYYSKGLVELYNNTTRTMLSYIEKFHTTGDISLLKLADLTKLYSKHLEQLGLKLSSLTRFKILNPP